MLDYVSEKAFEGLFSGAVPVYRGSSSIHKFMPHNTSFINASNMTPRELADVLLKYAKNEDLYNGFFQYKKMNNGQLPKHFEDIALMSYAHPNVVCRLCDKALKMMSMIENSVNNATTPTTAASASTAVH